MEGSSHEFLVKTSGEYINFEDNDELVQALQDEIAQLREDLLEAQKVKIEKKSDPQTAEMEPEDIEDNTLDNENI